MKENSKQDKCLEAQAPDFKTTFNQPRDNQLYSFSYKKDGSSTTDSNKNLGSQIEAQLQHDHTQSQSELSENKKSQQLAGHKELSTEDPSAHQLTYDEFNLNNTKDGALCSNAFCSAISPKLNIPASLSSDRLAQCGIDKKISANANCVTTERIVQSSSSGLAHESNMNFQHCASNSHDHDMSFISSRLDDPHNLPDKTPHQTQSECESYSDNEEESPLQFNDSCHNGRFVKHEDLISKSKYRTIHRGYDNESGCEIAWSTYLLNRKDLLEMKSQFLEALNRVQEVSHKYILKVIYFETRTARETKQNSIRKNLKTEELIVITELITAGSMREYLKKIRNPRIKVIKKWCTQITEGLSYLHNHRIIHGNLSCESIYINSNNGEIKIGDIGIKNVFASHKQGLDVVQEGNPTIQDNYKIDVYWFGLVLFEMISSSDLSGSVAVKYLHSLLQNSRKRKSVFEAIADEGIRDFLLQATDPNVEQRATFDQLQKHSFLLASSTQDTEEVKQTNSLANLIHEEQRRRKSKKQTKRIVDSTISSHFNFSCMDRDLKPDQRSDQINPCESQLVGQMTVPPKEYNSNSPKQVSIKTNIPEPLPRLPGKLQKTESMQNVKLLCQQRAESVLPSKNTSVDNVCENQVSQKSKRNSYSAFYHQHQFNNNIEMLKADNILQSPSRHLKTPRRTSSSEQLKLSPQFQPTQHIEKETQTKSVKKIEEPKPSPIGLKSTKLVVEINNQFRTFQVSCDYDFEKDSPEKIAEEMRLYFQLTEQSSLAIKQQIENVIKETFQKDQLKSRDHQNQPPIIMQSVQAIDHQPQQPSEGHTKDPNYVTQFKDSSFLTEECSLFARHDSSEKSGFNISISRVEGLDTSNDSHDEDTENDILRRKYRGTPEDSQQNNNQANSVIVNGLAEAIQSVQQNVPVVENVNEEDEPDDDNKAMIEQQCFDQHHHNNTTGEIHQELIQYQQQTGPIGAQEIVTNQLFRNSIIYKDQELGNFMKNDEKDQEIEEYKLNKRKTEDEEQLLTNLLEQLFPGYAMEYHEKQNAMHTHEGSFSNSPECITISKNQQHSPNRLLCSNMPVLPLCQSTDTMDLSMRSFDGIISSDQHSNKNQQAPFRVNLSDIDFDSEPQHLLYCTQVNCDCLINMGRKHEEVVVSNTIDSKSQTKKEEQTETEIKHEFHHQLSNPDWQPKQSLFLDGLGLSSIIFEQPSALHNLPQHQNTTQEITITNNPQQKQRVHLKKSLEEEKGLTIDTTNSLSKNKSQLDDVSEETHSNSEIREHEQKINLEQKPIKIQVNLFDELAQSILKIEKPEIHIDSHQPQITKSLDEIVQNYQNGETNSGMLDSSNQQPTTPTIGAQSQSVFRQSSSNSLTPVPLFPQHTPSVIECKPGKDNANLTSELPPMIVKLNSKESITSANNVTGRFEDNLTSTKSYTAGPNNNNVEIKIEDEDELAEQNKQDYKPLFKLAQKQQNVLFTFSNINVNQLKNQNKGVQAEILYQQSPELGQQKNQAENVSLISQEITPDYDLRSNTSQLVSSFAETHYQHDESPSPLVHGFNNSLFFGHLNQNKQFLDNSNSSICTDRGTMGQDAYFDADHQNKKIRDGSTLIQTLNINKVNDTSVNDDLSFRNLNTSNPVDSFRQDRRLSKFDQPMKSEMLKRGFKKMFKDDIILLKEAISIIFQNDRLLKERKQEGEIEKDQEESKFQVDSHFDRMTNRLVNKFKRKHDMEQDGIVDISFWEAIMNQAKRKLTKKESFYSRAQTHSYSPTIQQTKHRLSNTSGVDSQETKSLSIYSIPTNKTESQFRISLTQTPMLNVDDEINQALPSEQQLISIPHQASTFQFQQPMENNPPALRFKNLIPDESLSSQMDYQTPQSHPLYQEGTFDHFAHLQQNKQYVHERYTPKAKFSFADSDVFSVSPETQNFQQLSPNDNNMLVNRDSLLSNFSHYQGSYNISNQEEPFKQVTQFESTPEHIMGQGVIEVSEELDKQIMCRKLLNQRNRQRSGTVRTIIDQTHLEPEEESNPPISKKLTEVIEKEMKKKQKRDVPKNKLSSKQSLIGTKHLQMNNKQPK